MTGKTANRVADTDAGGANGPKASTAFFKEHDPLIRSVVSWSKWHFDAFVREDIAQKARRDLARALPSYRGKARIESFVKTICIRRCIDEVRRQVREHEVVVPLARRDEEGNWRVPDLPAGEEFDPVRTVELAERARALRQVMEAMDTTCRAAVRAFYLEGLSYREISDRLGITVNTVGSRLAKCLKKMREKILDHPELGEEFGA
jgi:RNA polymerase sigma-70 factor (ECF subfamily)